MNAEMQCVLVAFERDVETVRLVLSARSGVHRNIERVCDELEEAGLIASREVPVPGSSEPARVYRLTDAGRYVVRFIP